MSKHQTIQKKSRIGYAAQVQQLDKDLDHIRDFFSLAEDKGIDTFDVDGALNSVVQFINFSQKLLNKNRIICKK